MGEIKTAADEAFPDLGHKDPAKARVVLGLVDTAVETLKSRVDAAEQGKVGFKTWSELAAFSGTRIGQLAQVTADAGTHTDPVVGGTVDNEGEYRWSDDPAGWERIGDLADDAVVGEVQAARLGAPALADQMQVLKERTDALIAVQEIIGDTADPLGDLDTTAVLATYTFARPITKSGRGIAFYCYSRLSGGEVFVQLVSRDGTTNTVDWEGSFTLTAGENAVVFPDVDYVAGQHVGLYTPAGRIALTGHIDGNNGGYWSTFSHVTQGNSYTSGTLAAGRFAVRYELLEQAATGPRMAVAEEAIRTLEVTVGDSGDDTISIGRPADAVLIDGSDIGVNTYAYVEPAEEPLVLHTLDVFARKAGTMIARVLEEDVDGVTLKRVGPDYEIVIPTTGAQTLTDVPAVPLAPSQRLGFNRGSAIIALNTTGGDSGGIYSGAGNVTSFVKGAINSAAQIQLGWGFKPNGLVPQVAALRQKLDDLEGGITVDLLPHETRAYHLVWLLGESHVAGRATSFSSSVPAGRGYCYRRATASLGHLEDPTGNDATAVSGSGRGSWGPPIGQAMLDATHGAVGAVIVNSGLGSTTVADWGTSGGAWTQAKTDWDNAVAAIKAAKVPIAAVSIVVGIGSNDALAGTDKAIFKAGLLDMIERAQAYVAAGDVVPVGLIMTGPFADGSSATSVRDCQEAQAELARETAGVFIATSAPKFASDYGWFMDNVHFTQTANDAIAAGAAAFSLARAAGYPDGLE